MKHFFLLVLLFFANAFAAAAQTENIVWETDYKKALQQSRATGRPLMIDFTASWCKPCQLMDKEFWVSEEVIRAVKPFIAVKIDFDREKGVVDKFGVTGIPYVAFADPLGNLITFRLGFSRQKMAELHSIFNEMPKDFSPVLKYYDALDAKKDDGLALLQIAGAYRGAKMPHLSNVFYRKALKTPEIENDAEKRTNVYLSIAVNYLNLRDGKGAVEVMEDFLKTEPTGETKETGLYFITLGSAYARKFKDAAKYLQLLKAEFPSSAQIAKCESAIETAKNQPKEKP